MATTIKKKQKAVESIEKNHQSTESKGITQYILEDTNVIQKLSSTSIPSSSTSTNLLAVAEELPVGAQGRTASLVRKNVAIDLLVPNEHNPNEMDEASFNMLYDNIERVGLTDPILVRPLPDGRYKIVGGHHRWDVAKIHGLEEVPITVITDASFDDDAEKFQMVRHNIIHGKMSPKKFMGLYESLSGKYTEEVAAELFGFADEEDFKKLVASTAASLPKEMQQDFKKAAKEIKTVQDLSLVLNKMFTSHGDTVPYGYMIFDFGGQDHLWIRMANKQKQQMLNLGNLCRSNNRSLDGAMAVLLQLIATGDLSQAKFEEMFMLLPEVGMDNLHESEPPTEDAIAQADQLAGIL